MCFYGGTLPGMCYDARIISESSLTQCGLPSICNLLWLVPSFDAELAHSCARRPSAMNPGQERKLQANDTLKQQHPQKGSCSTSRQPRCNGRCILLQPILPGRVKPPKSLGRVKPPKSLDPPQIQTPPLIIEPYSTL